VGGKEKRKNARALRQWDMCQKKGGSKLVAQGGRLTKCFTDEASSEKNYLIKTGGTKRWKHRVSLMQGSKGLMSIRKSKKRAGGSHWPLWVTEEERKRIGRQECPLRVEKTGCGARGVVVRRLGPKDLEKKMRCFW